MEIKRALERKAGEFEANKETIADRIKEGIKTARERLNRVEKELLRGLEISFGPNEYAEQLAEINSGKSFSLDSAAAVAKTPVPAEYGPSEEAFGGCMWRSTSLLTRGPRSLPKLFLQPLKILRSAVLEKAAFATL